MRGRSTGIWIRREIAALVVAPVYLEATPLKGRHGGRHVQDSTEKCVSALERRGVLLVVLV